MLKLLFGSPFPGHTFHTMECFRHFCYVKLQAHLRNLHYNFFCVHLACLVQLSIILRSCGNHNFRLLERVLNVFSLVCSVR